MDYELVADTACTTGEGPLWHPDSDRLYWCDIPNGHLYQYDPTTATHERVYETSVIGGFTLQTDGSLLLFEDGGTIERWWPDGTETVVEGLSDVADTRFNDVTATPNGSVFCGTMPTEQQSGSLYRLATDGTIEQVFDDLDVPNGMDFTRDRTALYLTESSARTIHLCSYDERTDELSNRREFCRTPEGEGVPDGLTVDDDGYVWSARWNGSKLVRYTPEGRVEDELHIPVRKISSVTFGGDDYGTIYVTTAGGDHREKEGEHAGGLFEVHADAGGRPPLRSDVSAP